MARDSNVKIARATHTRQKPTQRPAGMASWNHSTPSANCRIGARYCSRPRVTSGTRIAAPPKQISGSAVTRPVLMNSRTWPAPWWVKPAGPAG